MPYFCAFPGCSEPVARKGRHACGAAHGLELRMLNERRVKEGKEPLLSGPSSHPQEPIGPPQETEVHERRGDQWNIAMEATRIFSEEQLVERFQIDTKVWRIKEFQIKRWEVAGFERALKKNQSDQWTRQYSKFILQPLYGIKAVLEKRPGMEFVLAELASLKADAAVYAPVIMPVLRSSLEGGYMVELNIPDIHFAKLAWGKETGFGDYDIHLATERFNRAFNHLLGSLVGYDIALFLFVIGNDIFQSDNLAGTTTKGTHVDVDGRFFKVFTHVRRLMAEKIEQLHRVAPVRVVMVGGNHDYQTVYCLGDSLDCWFRNTTEVEIDNTPTGRKFVQFGKVMIMLTHGDKGKKQDYPLVMATEAPKMWANTVYRECHTGHMHKDQASNKMLKDLDEYHGVKVRVLPSLSGTDAWHAGEFYTGNLKSAEAYIWHRESGLAGMLMYTDPDEPKQ